MALHTRTSTTVHRSRWCTLTTRAAEWVARSAAATTQFHAESESLAIAHDDDADHVTRLMRVQCVGVGLKVGHLRAAELPERHEGGLRWVSGDDSVAIAADPAPDAVDAGTGRLSWRLELGPGESATITLRAKAHLGRNAVFAGATRVPWSRPTLACVDRRLPQAVHQGLDDLEGLLLEDAVEGPDERGDLFAAAGSPWFLTLFGRDSLWTARMLMPLGTDLAMSTLRVLARRQGTRHDPESEEQPGRILHEVRAEPLALEHFTLPPTYYGTADATQLFVTCCAEAWRWGADPDEVRELIPAVERALGWMEEQAGDGFVRYVDSTGHGLSNQGWKDSVDSIQWADGSLAEPPIALSEVQAYAFQAAMLGADLLDGFDRPGGDRWRAWASSLAERFRERFWVEDADGRFPAVALDAQGAAVDSVASNMGHLLDTGLLDDEEAVAIAVGLRAANEAPGQTAGRFAVSIDHSSIARPPRAPPPRGGPARPRAGSAGRARHRSRPAPVLSARVLVFTLAVFVIGGAGGHSAPHTYRMGE